MISTALTSQTAAAMAEAARQRKSEPEAASTDLTQTIERLKAENAYLKECLNGEDGGTDSVLTRLDAVTAENRKLKTRLAANPLPAPEIEGAKIELKPESIRRDGGTQSRVELSEKTIERYAEAMREGVMFPPVKVYHDGKTYWLADGFHRVEAAVRAGETRVLCDVLQGTQRDAIRYSTGANKQHDKAGLGRTNADKRLAVTRMLQDAEWGQWSDRKIAEWCGVTHPFVAKIRQTLSGNRYQIDADGDSAIPQTRQVERGRTTYQMTVRKPTAPSSTAGETAKVRLVTDEFSQVRPADVPIIVVETDLPPQIDPVAQRKAYLNNQIAAATQLAQTYPSNATDEWLTPTFIISHVLMLWDAIDLDPCSNSKSAPNVPAKQHYTREEDGLAQDWHGRVFVNPPCGDMLDEWVDKALVEAGKGADDLLLLVPAQTDTGWMSKLDAYPRCYLSQRLKSAGAEVAAPFPACVVYLGDATSAFCRAFRDLGGMFVPMEM